MADDKKYTIAEFAARLRDEYDLAGDDTPDAELVRGYLGKHPEGMNQLVRTQAKPPKAPKQPEEPGLIPPGKDWLSALGLTGGEKPSSGIWDAIQSGLGPGWPMAKSMFHEGKRAVTQPLGPMTAVHGASALNPLAAPVVDPMSSALERGKPGEATTTGVLGTLGLAAMGPKPKMGPRAAGTELEEASAIGEGTVVDKAAMDVARVATKPVSTVLDGHIAEIEKAMANQHINAQRLTAGIAYEKQVLAKMEQMPATQLKDLRAAQEVVSDLDKAITGKKTMPWADARQALKKLHLAKLKLGDKDILSKIEKPLEEELMDSAKTAGHGDVYGQWVKDYRKMSNVQRAYAKSLSGKTEPQMRTKLTAKGAPAPKVLGTTVRLGRSRLGKITKTNADMLKKMDKAIDQLHKEVKARPGPTAPPRATPIPTPPPQGGGLPPVSGGSGPQVPPPETLAQMKNSAERLRSAGYHNAADIIEKKLREYEAASGSGGPMSDLKSMEQAKQVPTNKDWNKDYINSSKPISETQQALNDLLRPVQRPPLPPNVVVGEGMGAKVTEPGTGPARVLPWPTKKPE